MKTRFFVVLLALLGVLTIGCQKEVVNNVVVDNNDTLPLTGGWGAFQYLLVLEVVDQNGDNVLKGYQSYEIEDASAKVWCIEKGLFLDGQLVAGYAEGVNYFILDVAGQGMIFLPDAVEDATLVSEIICEEVFGDQEVRVIEAKWKKTKSDPLACTSFTFEDSTYYPSPKNRFMSAARVVINRETSDNTL